MQKIQLSLPLLSHNDLTQVAGAAIQIATMKSIWSFLISIPWLVLAPDQEKSSIISIVMLLSFYAGLFRNKLWKTEHKLRRLH